VALLHPSREELAHAALRLALTRTPIVGASDHGTHDAVYLPDPDGNELELAADRPRNDWPNFSNAYGGGPRPLDLNALLASVADDEPREHVDPALAVGHVHLHVNDLDAAVRFYRDVLGFEEQMRMPTASFLSVGGYHHHLAVNTWRGGGIPPAREDAVGLRHWTVELADEAQLDQVVERVRSAGYAVEERDEGTLVRDPANIALLITA
jgi:catechol 2,3-dioxygenase